MKHRQTDRQTETDPGWDRQEEMERGGTKGKAREKSGGKGARKVQEGRIHKSKKVGDGGERGRGEKGKEKEAT